MIRPTVSMMTFSEFNRTKKIIEYFKKDKFKIIKTGQNIFTGYGMISDDFGYILLKIKGRKYGS